MLDSYSRSRLLIIPFLLISLLSLSSCSNMQPKSEQAIVADLNASTNYIAPPIDMDECEIEKRRTDEEAGIDLIYLTVSGDNGEFECSLSYIVTYELYNEGWILETIERDYEGDWVLTGIDEDAMVEDIQSLTGHMDDPEWSGSVEFINVIDVRLPEYSDNPFEVIYTAELYFFEAESQRIETYELTYDLSQGDCYLRMCYPVSTQKTELY